MQRHGGEGRYGAARDCRTGRRDRRRRGGRVQDRGEGRRSRVLLPAPVARATRAAELDRPLSRRSPRDMVAQPDPQSAASGVGFGASSAEHHHASGPRCGGFGRRLVSEYDIEVARIAKLVTEERTAASLPSVPVKLLWTREDDMMHDQYRPAGAHYFKAGLDANGKLIAYRDFVGSTNSVVPANEFPRGFVDNVLVTAEQVKPFSVPTGALRAPPTNGVSFVIQGFIDEVAIAAGQDPIQYRLDLLNGPKGDGGAGGFNPARARGVLEAG